ncbi:MAG: DNA polymerase III subunit beta, partial [Muribaculaceae bacterium]|nr:DNA polymerase III subunit beta [Muribaculaceae bacterium]
MKFKVPSRALYNAASAVSKVINSKNVLEILNNFLIEIDENKMLTVTGSDTENSLTARIQLSEADGTIRFCLDARRLVELLRELPEQAVTFEVNESTLAIEITYPGGNYNLVGLNGDEFPLPRKDSENSDVIKFECPATQLAGGIDNSLFAVSNDEFRPQMMGIYLDIHNEDITFVATDTRKLVKFTDSTAAPGVTASCILPVKPATIIKNIFGKSEDSLTIRISDKRIEVENANYSLSSPFIKGNFPDYKRVIPENNPYTLTVDRQSLLTAVRRVGVFVESGVGLVRFRISSDRIYLKSQDNSLCVTAREEVPCSYDGNELVIGFSAPYLIEILNTLSTDDIVVKLSDPGRPGVF